MAIPVPAPGDMVDANVWGAPISNEVNRLTTVTTPSAWQAIPPPSGFVAGNATFGSYAFRIIGSVLYSRGSLTYNGAGVAAGTQVGLGTLPAGYRPAVSSYVTVLHFKGNTPYAFSFYVGSDGTLAGYSAGAIASGETIYFGGVAVPFS